MYTDTMFVLSVVSLFILVEVGSAIRCYDCNSANNSMCMDPAIYDAESVQKYLKTTNCDKRVMAGGQQGSGKMFCRKIIQTILHKGHDAEVRVTRGCGWVKHHRDCYKADNDDHLETVCQCFSDDCNSATLSSVAAFLVPLSVITIFVQ